MNSPPGTSMLVALTMESRTVASCKRMLALFHSTLTIPKAASRRWSSMERRGHHKGQAWCNGSTIKITVRILNFLRIPGFTTWWCLEFGTRECFRNENEKIPNRSNSLDG